MSYIYKIVNDINNKIYVGKTNLTIEERFKEHRRDYKRERCEKRPLYAAMNKYGVEHFRIEQLEQCLPEETNEREKYWIEYLGSFKNGYNATIGGDGTQYIDYELVVKTYNEIQNMAETARLLNIKDTHTVAKILKLYNIERKTGGEVTKIIASKQVAMLDKNTEEILKVFPSIQEAERYLGISYKTHISKVCNGKRKTCQGYKWKYI